MQAPRGKAPSFVSQSVSATKRIRIEFCLRAPSNTTARLVALQPGGISLQLRWGHVALAVARPGNLRQATRHAAVTGRRSDVELAVDGAGRRVELYVGGVEQAAFAGNAVAPRLLEIGRLTSSPTSAITLSGLTAATSAGQLIPARAPPPGSSGQATNAPPASVVGVTSTAAAGAGTASSGGTAGTDSAGGDGTSSAGSAGGDGDLTNPGWPGNPFSPTSFWNAALAATAPLDPNSQAYVNELVRQVKAYRPWMNTTSYSVPVYVVGADQPTVHVTLDSWGPDLQAAFDAVPIPDNAKAAAGSDEHMVVWQPTTDKMWEFFEMHQESDGWHASWGGEMDNVSTNPGYFTHEGQSTNWGATATGLPLLGGLVTAADLERGYINHALAISLVETDKAVLVVARPAHRRRLLVIRASPQYRKALASVLTRTSTSPASTCRRSTACSRKPPRRMGWSSATRPEQSTSTDRTRSTCRATRGPRRSATSIRMRSSSSSRGATYRC